MTDFRKIGNEELLRTSDRLLTNLEQQRKYLMQRALRKRPCPNCGTPQDYFQASGIAPDAWDFGTTKLTYRCVACKRELRDTLTLIGEEYWELVPIAPPRERGAR